MSNLSDKLLEMGAKEVSDIYKRVFDTVDGQLMLEDLKNRCYVNTTTYGTNDIHFNEGMRAVVLHIQSQVNYKEETEGNIL